MKRSQIHFTSRELQQLAKYDASIKALRVLISDLQRQKRMPGLNADVRDVLRGAIDEALETIDVTEFEISDLTDDAIDRMKLAAAPKCRCCKQVIRK